jgi:hypothetical protein
MPSPDLFKEKASTQKAAPGINKQPISPTVINRIIIGIILLIIVIQIGFFKTYIQHFPKFEEYTAGHGNTKYNFIMHFHGMMMMGWVWMLLLQPILILKGKTKLHRRIGSLSYVLAPLVLLSLYLVNRDQYLNISAYGGQTAAIAALALTLPEAVFFAILYPLAIFYRHRPRLHMRFMCSTAFLFINPALGRMFRTYFDFKSGFAISSLIVLLLAGVITVVDSLRTKRVSPFTLVFGLLLLHRIIWELRDTSFWQATGNLIAKIF